MDGHQPLLILINGAVPGLGKSTLAQGLAGRLRDSGLDVELFQEQEILDRVEFAAVIEEWRSTNRAASGTLLAGTSKYLEWSRRRSAKVDVFDSLLPFLPSLLAWGRSDAQIAEFFRQLARLMHGFDVHHVQLEGNARRSLNRAREREGGAWLEQLVTKVRNYGDEGSNASDLESLIKYFESATTRSHELLATAPWSVCFVDADQDRALVERRVVQHVGAQTKLPKEPSRCNAEA